MVKEKVKSTQKSAGVWWNWTNKKRGWSFMNLKFHWSRKFSVVFAPSCFVSFVSFSSISHFWSGKWVEREKRLIMMDPHEEDDGIVELDSSGWEVTIKMGKCHWIKWKFQSYDLSICCVVSFFFKKKYVKIHFNEKNGRIN